MNETNKSTSFEGIELNEAINPLSTMDSRIEREKKESKTMDELAINRTMGAKSQGPGTPGYKGYLTIIAKSPNREVILQPPEREDSPYGLDSRKNGRMSSIVSELTARASEGG